MTMAEAKNGVTKDKTSKKIWRLQDDKRVLKDQLDEKEHELKELKRRVKAKVIHPDGTEATFLQRLVAKYWNAVVVPPQFLDSLKLTLLTLQEEFYDIVNMVKMGHTVHIKEFVKSVRNLIANLLNCSDPVLKSLTIQAAMQLSLFVNQVQAFKKSRLQPGDLKFEDFEQQNRIITPGVVDDRTLVLGHQSEDLEHTESVCSGGSTSESLNPTPNGSFDLTKMFLKVLEKVKRCDSACFLTSGVNEYREDKKRREEKKIIRQSYKSTVANVLQNKYDTYLKFETKLLQLVERLNQFEVTFHCQQTGQLAAALITIIADTRSHVDSFNKELPCSEEVEISLATDDDLIGQSAEPNVPRHIESGPIVAELPSSLDALNLSMPEDQGLNVAAAEPIECVATNRTLTKDGLYRFLNILRVEYVSVPAEEFMNAALRIKAFTKSKQKALDLVHKVHDLNKKFKSHDGFTSYKVFEAEVRRLICGLDSFGNKAEKSGIILSSSLSNMLRMGKKEFDWKPNLLSELEDDIFFESYKSNTIYSKPYVAPGSTLNSSSRPAASQVINGNRQVTSQVLPGHRQVASNLLSVQHQVPNVPVPAYIPFPANQPYADGHPYLNQFIMSLIQRHIAVCGQIFCGSLDQIGLISFEVLNLKQRMSAEIMRFVRNSILSMQSGKYVVYWQFETDVEVLKCTLVDFMQFGDVKTCSDAFNLYQASTTMMVVGRQEIGSYAGVLMPNDSMVYPSPLFATGNDLVYSL